MPYKDPEKQKEARKRWEEKNKKEREQRKEFYLFVFYPESAPENWREIIDRWMVDVLVSPLHDRDVNPDGTYKKPHYHGVIIFDQKKNYNEVAKLLSELNGPIPIVPCGSKRNAVLYLIHYNNPEKYQYSREDIIEFGSARFENIIGDSNVDDANLLREMMAWCSKWELYSYARLVEYAAKNNSEWFKCLMERKTYIMVEYLKSLYNTKLNEKSAHPYCRYDLEEIEKLEAAGIDSAEAIEELKRSAE